MGTIPLYLCSRRHWDNPILPVKKARILRPNLADQRLPVPCRLDYYYKSRVPAIVAESSIAKTFVSMQRQGASTIRVNLCIHFPAHHSLCQMQLRSLPHRLIFPVLWIRRMGSRIRHVDRTLPRDSCPAPPAIRPDGMGHFSLRQVCIVKQVDTSKLPAKARREVS